MNVNPNPPHGRQPYAIGTVLASTETHLLVAITENSAEWQEREIHGWPERPPVPPEE